MQALAELDADTARALRGVVFDVDDTVTRGGRLEEAAFRALWRLKDAGLHLFALTGRPLGFAEIIARTWPVDGAVGENGAGFIRVTERGLHEGFYAPPAERNAHTQLLAEVSVRVTREAPFAKLADDSWARRCDIAWDVGERVQLPAAQIEELRRLIEATPGVRAVISSVHAHAVAGQYDKATGAQLATREILQRDLNAERERWLFVGDSGNDAAAFAYFPVTAGVANVQRYLHTLPTPPRFVSREDHGRGFAEIAERVLALRQP